MRGLSSILSLFRNQFNKLNYANGNITLHSLNEGITPKWPDKSFRDNDNFSMGKVVGSVLELSTNRLFTLNKY